MAEGQPPINSANSLFRNVHFAHQSKSDHADIYTRTYSYRSEPALSHID